jgi:hypothetical protein
MRSHATAKPLTISSSTPSITDTSVVFSCSSSLSVGQALATSSMLTSTAIVSNAVGASVGAGDGGSEGAGVGSSEVVG